MQKFNDILRLLKNNSKNRVPIQHSGLNNNNDNLRENEGLTRAKV